MKRPNILFIYTDQQRFDALGANGNPLIKTPNLDRLAATGTNYNRCFSQNPVCMPSRLSAMTGQYCSALGITRMGVTVPEDTLTIQKILRGYGYDTALVGKLHYLPHANRDHRWPHPAYDFNHMELCDEPGCYEDAYRAFVRRLAPDQMDYLSLGLPPANAMWQELMRIDDGIKHPPPRTYSDPGNGAFPGRSDCTNAAFVGRQTIEYINSRANAGEPFFCFSGFYSPHSPFVAPQEFLDLYRQEDMPLPHMPDCTPEYARQTQFSTQCYYAMVSEVDHWVGKIYDALEQNGQADNTIIVFTSDHGEWLGEHGQYGKGYFAADVVSRVPMIYHVPEALGGIAHGNSDEIVECVDIVPTLLSLCAIQIPPCVQGRVLPVAQNLPATQGDGCGLTEFQNWRSLRCESYRYVANANGREMLFDMEKDPFEYNDVAADPAYHDALHDMRGAMIKRMLKVDKPCEIEFLY
ncbi:MAG: sulfatase-like hydrolase/transferase [Clostridia bacterium]|nr:sulfatase-like hydrolase/transferase [Clostridia bacterium]